MATKKFTQSTPKVSFSQSAVCPAPKSRMLGNPINELRVSGSECSGIVYVDVSGWLSHRTAAEFNLALSGFNQAKGVLLDCRHCILNLTIEEAVCLRHILECPIAYIATPEQADIIKAMVGTARGFGLARLCAYERQDAECWLQHVAMRHNM